MVKSVLMSAEFFLLPFKSLLFSASYNCRHTQEVVDFVVVKMLDPEVDPFSPRVAHTLIRMCASPNFVARR